MLSHSLKKVFQKKQWGNWVGVLGAIAPIEQKNAFLYVCKNKFTRLVLFCYRKLLHVSILVTVKMSIADAKAIQYESFKNNIFSNRDVNRGSLISLCPSLGFSPANLI